MTYSNETPAVALLVGQQKEMIKGVLREVLEEMGLTNYVAPTLTETLPETFNKQGCKEMTGYAINTINRMICDKAIPYYKMNSRVIFKRDEIREWMLKNRIATSEEFTAAKEVELSKKLRK